MASSSVGVPGPWHLGWRDSRRPCWRQGEAV